MYSGKDNVWPAHVTKCALFAVLCALLAGCSKNDGIKLVNVSGTIKLNGAPLPNAIVTFVPLSSDKLAPTSVGKTNSQGKYELRTVMDDKKGAIVGKHLVRVELKDYEEDPSDDSSHPHRDSIPAKYNYESELTYDVPAEGTTSADFFLQVP